MVFEIFVLRHLYRTEKLFELCRGKLVCIFQLKPRLLPVQGVIQMMDQHAVENGRILRCQHVAQQSFQVDFNNFNVRFNWKQE